MDTSCHAVKTNISRRSFIKASALSCALVGGLGLTACTPGANQAADQHLDERIAYTYHPMNCGNRCSLACTVRDGRLVHIKPNTWSGPEKNFSICCLKGMSEIQRVYSPDRIQTPMRCVGERGSGEFESISWDEALKEVADALSSSAHTHGGKSILFTHSSSIDYPMPLLPVLLGAQSITESGIDMGHGNGLDPTFGDAAVGIMNKELYDWVNSKTLILVGSNIMETGLTEAQYVLDAKEAGAHLIVVDPVHTATAAKADWWIPIRPGSDSALYLGMISAILDNHWYDEAYLKAYTAAPFLVGPDGHLLREHTPQEGDTGQSNPFLVYDENTKAVKPYNGSDLAPALHGTWNVSGTEVSTVFDLLVKNQKPYTLEWASQKTEIPADDILKLARLYAQDTPSFLGVGFGGADKYANADITGHAAAILPALTGNMGKPGAGIGVVYSVVASEGSAAKLGEWTLPEQFALTELEMQTPLMRTQPNSVRVVVNHGNSLVQHLGNWETTKRWLKTLDKVITINPYFCDSCEYSDIILPATTCFEMHEPCGSIQISKNHMLIQQKVIDPLFDAKTDFDIERELGELLGFGAYLPSSREELVRTELTTDDPMMKGITYEALMEHNGIMRLNVSDQPFDGHAGQTYNTPSGRIEFYHEQLVEEGQALPNFEDHLEVGADNPLREKYPLQFWQARRRYRVHTQFENSTWINQIAETGSVRLSPQDAEERGLHHGDPCSVFNDRGKIRATVHIDESLRPGSAVMGDGSWNRDTGGSSFQTLVNDTLIKRGAKLVYGAPIPFYDTLVQVAPVKEGSEA